MSKGRLAAYVCTFCHLCRPCPPAKPRPALLRRSSETAAATAAAARTQKPPADDQHGDATSVPFGVQDLQAQFDLYSVADAFRSIMLDPRATNRSRSIGNAVVTKLSSTSPSAPQPHRDPFSALFAAAIDTQAGASPNVSPAEAIDLLRFQLDAASSAEDIARILTLHLRDPADSDSAAKARFLATNPQLLRALRSKLPHLPPSAQLALIGLLASRLEAHAQKLDASLVTYAINVAATIHSLPALAQFLKRLLGNASPLPPSQLVTILASVKIGLSENNVCKATPTSNIKAVRQLLFSSTDDCCLEKLLPSNNPDLLAPWLHILVAVKAKQKIWEEWILIQSKQRWHDPALSSSQISQFHKKRLGFFILAFFRIGAASEAWKVFKDSDKLIAESVASEDQSAHPLDLYGIHRSVWAALLTHWSSQPKLPETLQRALTQSLLSRLEYLMAAAEAELGLTWHQAATETGSGYHTVIPLSQTREDDPAVNRRLLTRDPEAFRDQSFTTKLLDLHVSRINTGAAAAAATTAQKKQKPSTAAIRKLWMDPSIHFYKSYDALETAVFEQHMAIGLPRNEQTSALLIANETRLRRYYKFVLDSGEAAIPHPV